MHVSYTQTKNARKSEWLSHPNSSTPLGFSLRFLKRMIDILIGFITCMSLLVWFIPLVAILIKIDSPGPIFFLQNRVGHRGRIFLCFKLRTMYDRPQHNFSQTIQNDPRITRLGKWLRKTNLDELPQIINVLIGDMSLVGPRPHALEHDAEFKIYFPNFDQRYQIKPGLTGLAQVRGARGITNFRKMRNRLKYDLYYISRYSLLLDLKICWWTVKAMLKGDENAW